jgi:hypothetical protein
MESGQGIDNRVLEPLVDGTLVKGVYVVRLEEGLVSWWPPKLDNEINTLIANISVPMVNGLYFVIGNGFFPEVQVRGGHNVENHTTVQDREDGERGPDRGKAEQDHTEIHEKIVDGRQAPPSHQYSWEGLEMTSVYKNCGVHGVYTTSLMGIIFQEVLL